MSGKETEKRTVHVMFQEDDENVDRDGAEAVFVRVYFKTILENCNVGGGYNFRFTECLDNILDRTAK